MSETHWFTLYPVRDYEWAFGIKREVNRYKIQVANLEGPIEIGLYTSREMRQLATWLLNELAEDDDE